MTVKRVTNEAASALEAVQAYGNPLEDPANVAGWSLPPHPFPSFPIVEKLAEIEAGTYERVNRPRDRIWASQLGACGRAIWHSWHHPRPHDEAFSQHRGALGHAIEDLVFETWMKRATIAREVSFTTERVSGRVDGFVRFHKDEHQIPVEVKSTYGFDMAFDKPHKSHVAQLAWYMQQDDSPYGLLFYVDLANYADHAGYYGAMAIPRADPWIDALIAQAWKIVHTDAPPHCQDPGFNARTKKPNCFDCKSAECVETG